MELLGRENRVPGKKRRKISAVDGLFRTKQTANASSVFAADTSVTGKEETFKTAERSMASTFK